MDMVPEIEIQEIANYVEKINVYDGGTVTEYSRDDEKFKEICAAWTGMLKFAHQMPAYGVSLHNQTLEEIRRGIWTEFSFSQQYCNNGMPFEKLLVNVQPEFSGFNVIRYNSDMGYDGRCFYFSLIDSDMADFYNVLKK